MAQTISHYMQNVLINIIHYYIVEDSEKAMFNINQWMSDHR